MAFASCPETEYDSFAAFWDIALVRIFDDGRIEEGSRLNGEFLCEIGSDDVSCFLRQRFDRDIEVVKQVFYPFEILVKCSCDIAVASGKVSQDLLEQPGLLVLGHCQDHPNGCACPVLSGQEETGDDTPGIGVEIYGFSLDGDCHKGPFCNPESPGRAAF